MRNTLTSIAEHSDWLQSLHISDRKRWHLHRLRIEFGKQPLEIWQFVACKLVDGVWVPYDSLCCGRCEDGSDDCIYITEHKEYQEAKSRCIFEGFIVSENNGNIILTNGKNSILFSIRNFIKQIESNIRIETIEDLVKYNSELTPTGLKDSGYE